MADVARVDHEGGLCRQGIYLGDALLERADGVGIWRLEVKADMAVADLQEGEGMRFLRGCLVDKAQRVRHAARNGPQHAGSNPGHAFENFAPTDAVFAVEFAHCLSPLKPEVQASPAPTDEIRRVQRLFPAENYFSARAAAGVFSQGLRAPPGATATRKIC